MTCGVRQPAGGLDFLVEPGQPLGAKLGNQLAAKHLQGGNAAQMMMPGLVDRAHRALAQPAQQDIGPDDQLIAAPLHQSIRLKGREPVAVEEVLRQRVRVADRPAADLRRQFLEPALAEQLMLSQGIDERRDGGHIDGASFAVLWPAQPCASPPRPARHRCASARFASRARLWESESGTHQARGRSPAQVRTLYSAAARPGSASAARAELPGIAAGSPRCGAGRENRSAPPDRSEAASDIRGRW